MVLTHYLFPQNLFKENRLSLLEVKGMKKEGSAHFEIVVAFTLFIVFTIFLLYFLKAPENNTISDTILNGLESSFLNSTTVEMASFVVTPNQSGCVKFDLSNLSLKGNSSVVNLEGAKKGWKLGQWTIVDTGSRSSKFESNILTINAAGINVSQNESLKVYISEAISAGSSGCSSPNLSSVVGTIKREKILSEIKLRQFEQNYSNNYSFLKDSLGLPSNVDFAVESENFLNATKGNVTVDTQSKQIFMDVVFANGTIIKKSINLIVW